ncbi:MAG TPA: molybdenum cofactor biosynthesis protein MoaE [Candidatus Krumholzibacteria bacterium]|nr:molybdenum cofactor biosynthesis protein MoaE [Candidatus Krumholzibacteria bacterium]
MSPAETDDRLRVALVHERIDLGALYAAMGDPGAGAVLAFAGVVRDSKNGRRVLRLEYEAYESMAAKALERIGKEVLARWPVRRVVLVHRVGMLQVGETSVAILVATAHRAPGFEALRHAIEVLKKDVPIWKKEHFEDGEVWVQEGS